MSYANENVSLILHHITQQWQWNIYISTHMDKGLPFMVTHPVHTNTHTNGQGSTMLMVAHQLVART